MNPRIGLIPILAMSIVAVIATTSGKAFTSGAAVRLGGEGGDKTTGYAVSSVSYASDATDPGRLSAVSFTITPRDALHVNVELVANSDVWFPCTNARGRVTCAVSIAIGAIDALNVVATS